MREYACSKVCHFKWLLALPFQSRMSLGGVGTEMEKATSLKVPVIQELIILRYNINNIL